jgi:hypothetical protein
LSGFHTISHQENILAKRTNYQGEKRAKELNRLKKQTEKKERKKNGEQNPTDDPSTTEDNTVSTTAD